MQLAQKEQVIKAMTAQLQAHKQALNEFLEANLHLKGNLNILQSMLNEATHQLAESNNNLAKANAQIDQLSNMPINDLESEIEVNDEEIS